MNVIYVPNTQIWNPWFLIPRCRVRKLLHFPVSFSRRISCFASVPSCVLTHFTRESTGAFSSILLAAQSMPLSVPCFWESFNPTAPNLCHLASGQKVIHKYQQRLISKRPSPLPWTKPLGITLRSLCRRKWGEQTDYTKVPCSSKLLPSMWVIYISRAFFEFSWRVEQNKVLSN